MKLEFSTALCVVTLLTTGSTLAAAESVVPPGCQENRSAVPYRAGVAVGKMLVDRAWNSISDCNQLDRFSDIVLSNLQSYTLAGTTAYTICQYTGTVDGAREELDAIWASCPNSDCCRVSMVIGELSGRLYCQLSELLGGAAAPDDFVARPVHTTCAEFQQCCDGAFVDTTSSQCGTYTMGSFYSVWLQSRKWLCAIAD